MRVNSVPKSGHPAAHNKDRVGVDRRPRHGLGIAVADGATNAYKAEDWAALVVDAWGTRRLSPARANQAVASHVDALAEMWRQLASPSDDASWYVSAKAALGSFTTLLGLEIRRRGHAWAWDTFAVGDTDLLIVDRDGQLRVAFPVSDPRYFGSQPPLIGTTGANPDLEPWRRLRSSGTFRRGERLFVATDALAACLLFAHRSGEPLWDAATIASMSPIAFEGWISGQRELGTLADDDTTLVFVERAP